MNPVIADPRPQIDEAQAAEPGRRASRGTVAFWLLASR
jgi:hypothetical protein